MKISLVNASYMRIDGLYDDLAKLSQHFTFEVPGFQHIPAYKNGYWDGRIRLFDGRTQMMYAGLYEKVKEFGDQEQIPVEVDPALEVDDPAWTDEVVAEHIKALELTKEPRPYQIEALKIALRRRRGLYLMPTGSGKSLVVYMLMRILNLKSLIIVPRTGLVKQLTSDFAEYGYKDEVHQIYAGQEKDSSNLITISTWQSIRKMPRAWLSQFDVVLVDEAHEAKAKELTGILERATDVYYRYGVTGTLDGTKTNGMVLEGLFGPVSRIRTTAELIDDGFLANLKVSFLLLNYPEEERRQFWSADREYDEEINYIVAHPKRNSIIRKIAISRKGNTLVIFRFRKHGKLLYEAIKAKTDRPVYFIDGQVDIDVREDIRLKMEMEDNAILVGSTQTVSTGINIPSLTNVIFAHPTKAKIRNLQSIGRALRTTIEKSQAYLFDIADDLSVKTKRGQRRRNMTLNHFLVRVDTYSKEKFPYTISNVDMGTTKTDGG